MLSELVFAVAVIVFLFSSYMNIYPTVVIKDGFLLYSCIFIRKIPELLMQGGIIFQRSHWVQKT